MFERILRNSMMVIMIGAAAGAVLYSGVGLVALALGTAEITLPAVMGSVSVASHAGLLGAALAGGITGGALMAVPALVIGGVRTLLHPPEMTHGELQHRLTPPHLRGLAPHAPQAVPDKTKGVTAPADRSQAHTEEPATTPPASSLADMHVHADADAKQRGFRARLAQERARPVSTSPDV